MTESENEKIVKKIFEAMNRHDLEAHMSYLSDDVKVVWPSGLTVDKERLRRERVSDAIPDSIIRVDRMVSQGNTVWVESTFARAH